MLERIVLNYQMLVSNMGQLIEISGFRNDYLSQKIGLKPANFSVKKQKGNWTTTEVLKLLSIIQNKEVEDYIDVLKMKEIKKGNFISSDEFEKRMKW
ncbi:hypothetical protein QWZ08_20150 [Ferruginibacter paludis]|uniref:hypothetical protein n=1 Tax=Ferruginibacter paludis TaxID=1310417 RepID=UPI0025B39970|nr:hypothetical protein [Ferruginibacter paludis]MDN3657975.1 hypothetical protein [Ferruginibacter paludis]